MIPLSETSTVPVTGPKEIEIYDLPDKVFKIIIPNANEHRQLNESRKIKLRKQEA